MLTESQIKMEVEDQFVEEPTAEEYEWKEKKKKKRKEKERQEKESDQSCTENKENRKKKKHTEKKEKELNSSDSETPKSKKKTMQPNQEEILTPGSPFSVRADDSVSAAQVVDDNCYESLHSNSKKRKKKKSDKNDQVSREERKLTDAENVYDDMSTIENAEFSIVNSSAVEMLDSKSESKAKKREKKKLKSSEDFSKFFDSLSEHSTPDVVVDVKKKKNSTKKTESAVDDSISSGMEIQQELLFDYEMSKSERKMEKKRLKRLSLVLDESASDLIHDESANNLNEDASGLGVERRKKKKKRNREELEETVPLIESDRPCESSFKSCQQLVSNKTSVDLSASASDQRQPDKTLEHQNSKLTPGENNDSSDQSLVGRAVSSVKVLSKKRKLFPMNASFFEETPTNSRESSPDAKRRKRNSSYLKSTLEGKLKSEINLSKDPANSSLESPIPSTSENRRRLDAESPQNTSLASKTVGNLNSLAINSEFQIPLNRALSKVMSDEKKRRESHSVKSLPKEDFIISALRAATQPFNLQGNEEFRTSAGKFPELNLVKGQKTLLKLYDFCREYLKRPLPKLNAENHCLSFPVREKLANLKQNYPGFRVGRFSHWEDVLIKKNLGKMSVSLKMDKTDIRNLLSCLLKDKSKENLYLRLYLGALLGWDLLQNRLAVDIFHRLIHLNKLSRQNQVLDKQENLEKIAQLCNVEALTAKGKRPKFKEALKTMNLGLDVDSKKLIWVLNKANRATKADPLSGTHAGRYTAEESFQLLELVMAQAKTKKFEEVNPNHIKFKEFEDIMERTKASMYQHYNTVIQPALLHNFDEDPTSDSISAMKTQLFQLILENPNVQSRKDVNWRELSLRLRLSTEKLRQIVNSNVSPFTKEGNTSFREALEKAKTKCQLDRENNKSLRQEVAEIRRKAAIKTFYDENFSKLKKA